MIPASYLFKDVYRHTWIDQDIEAAAECQPHPRKGHPLWSRLLTALSALRIQAIADRHGGIFAHD